MASPASAPRRFFVLSGSTGTFPAETEWLSFVNPTPGTDSLTIQNDAGDTGAVSLPSGMWPIRCRSVTANTGVTNVIGWWT